VRSEVYVDVSANVTGIIIIVNANAIVARTVLHCPCQRAPGTPKTHTMAPRSERGSRVIDVALLFCQPERSRGEEYC
jgi:hypothetical protein